MIWNASYTMFNQVKLQLNSLSAYLNALFSNLGLYNMLKYQLDDTTVKNNCFVTPDIRNVSVYETNLTKFACVICWVSYLMHYGS